MHAAGRSARARLDAQCQGSPAKSAGQGLCRPRIREDAERVPSAREFVRLKLSETRPISTVPLAILRVLAVGPDAAVRCGVASERTLDRELFEQLAEDSDESSW
jgi:hypothetical protein